MQGLVTGTDADGRSCVIARDTAGAAPVNGVTFVDTLLDTTLATLPPRPPGSGDQRDFGTAGSIRWSIVDFEAGRTYPRHHSDTIDLDMVMAGSIDLILDDGTHPLTPGDCVIVNGIDHGWQVGPEGCQMSVVVIGTPPLPE